MRTVPHSLAQGEITLQSRRKRNDTWTLKVKKEIGADDIDGIEELYMYNMKEGDNLIVDFRAECSIPQKNCISFLIRAHAWVALRGGFMVVVPQQQLRQKLAIMGLIEIFHTAPSLIRADKTIRRLKKSRIAAPPRKGGFFYSKTKEDNSAI